MQIMPFEEAETYRFNPFDLTKVWPHADYPLHEVGRLTLNRNPTDFHTEIEQAAFEPNNLVPGIGVSPDKMLLGRLFAYADAHRAPAGGQLQADPGQPAQVAGAQLQQGRRDAGRKRVRPGVRAELEGRPEGRRRALSRVGDLGGQRRVHPRRLHPAQGRRRLGASPALWCAR